MADSKRTRAEIQASIDRLNAQLNRDIARRREKSAAPRSARFGMKSRASQTGPGAGRQGDSSTDLFNEVEKRVAQAYEGPAKLPPKASKGPENARVTKVPGQIKGSVHVLNPNWIGLIEHNIVQIMNRMEREVTAKAHGKMKGTFINKVSRKGKDQINIIFGNSDPGFAYQVTGSGTQRVLGEGNRQMYPIIPTNLGGGKIRNRGHVTGGQLEDFMSFVRDWNPSSGVEKYGVLKLATSSVSLGSYSPTAAIDKANISFDVSGVEGGTKDRVSFMGRKSASEYRPYVTAHPGAKSNDQLQKVWVAWTTGDRVSKESLAIMKSGSGIWNQMLAVFSGDTVLQAKDGK